ncbi:MAG: ImmA/IrrE family metallo-endopeptidase [Methyloglobulus sp.]
MPISKAQEILARYWDGKLPIDPIDFANKMGITVKPIESCEYSGKAYQENGLGFIEYDWTEFPLRQRFTIAHELGHIVLGHTDNGHQFRDEVSKFNFNITIPEETQAIKFAAELLAPEIAIKHFVFKDKISSIEELSKLFLVSTVAMKYRLTNLGLM